MARAPVGPLPEPPVPAKADLRRLPKMMVDVAGILTGDVAMGHDRNACWTWFIARCSAWHQIPAGSLPAKDTMLARLLGFGADVNEFRRMRKRGGLAGWFLAADGRLYHPEVARDVLEALELREAWRARTKNAREARSRERTTRGSGTAAKGEAPPKPTGTTEKLIGTSRKLSGTKPGPMPQPVEDVQPDVSVTGSKLSKEKESEEREASVHASGDDGGENRTGAPGTLERRLLPKLSDPHHLWACLTPNFGIDAEGKRHPKVKGYFLDVVCKEICAVARILDPHWRGDWDTVSTWLHEGFYPNAIIDAISDRAERPGYKRPSTLRYFDGVLREWVLTNPVMGRRRPEAEQPATSSPSASNPRMPRLSDPLDQWACLTTESGLDEEGQRRPIVKGYYFDTFCRTVCTAACITDPQWRGDWRVVAQWLHDGISSNKIIEAIEEVMERRSGNPPAVLGYFDRAVRAYHVAHPGNGRDRNPPPARGDSGQDAVLH